jgi:peroxiredoxin Q/BCP
MAFPKIGNIAPAFTLLDQNGDKVSLKQFRDNSNVALYFYPKAMTPGCTVQACGIRDSKKALAKLDTVV